MEIERVARGRLGRKACHRLKEERLAAERAAIFQYQASVIQHVFRGFYSRRFKHDFYARKAYIANILEKSNSLRVELAANRERAAQEEQARRMESMQAEFKKVASGLHHLLSTKSRPGVYNSPFALDGPPTAFGVSVEDHLRDSTADILRESLRTKGRGAPKPRIKRSIQSDSHYDTAKEAERCESRRSITMRVSNRDFLAGGKVEHKVHVPLSNGEVYLDNWIIQKPSRDQPLRNSQKPFVTALSKNQTFDEIADAVAI